MELIKPIINKFLKISNELKYIIIYYRFKTEDLIKWVITVPAIWSDEAKTFMRDAAFEVIFCLPGLYRLSHGHILHTYITLPFWTQKLHTHEKLLGLIYSSTCFMC